MKKTPSIIDTYYKSLGTKIFRDTTALPFADGGPLNDRNIHGDLLPSVYASALGRYYGSGGQMKPDYSLPEDNFQQGGQGLKNSVYASSMGQYPAPYADGGLLDEGPGPKPKFKPQPKPLVITDPQEYAFRKAAYDDSLWLYQHNQRNPMLRKPNNYRNNGNWFHDLLAWSGNETISNKKNFTLTPEQFKKGHLRQIDKNAIARFANNTGITTVGNALLDGHVSTKNSFKTRDEYDLTTAAEDLKNRYSPIRQKYPLIPWNDPIAYVGKTAKYTDNIKQAGDYLSQIETRYKKPIQPVLFKEETKPTKKIYPPVVKKPVTYVNPPVEERIPIEQPQPPIQDNYPPPPPITEGFPPGPPPPPPFNGVEPFIEGDPIPEYATPDPGAEFVPDTERYIDWNGNSIGFNGIRFRKPRHGGDLIKKGSRHYLHYPSIETRHSADIVPEDTEEFAQGGAMNQYPDGGPIYTYAKRPGSYYQKDDSGQWYISNKGTGGQYVPVDDPSGQRAAALNKGAVVTMANPTADKYSNVAPSYGQSPMVQSVAGRTEAERQPVQNAIDAQRFAQTMEQDYAQATKDQLPQHEQPIDMMDYAWQAAAGAPAALKGLGQVAALKIPFTEMSLGTAANLAGGVHGATQIPNRVQDWQDVSAGDKTWQEATAKTIGTGLELGAGALETANAINMYKFNPTGTSLEGGQVANTVYPQVITSPTTGLKQYGSTTLLPFERPMAPAGLIRSNNTTYSDAALLPIDQQPFKLTAAQMEARNPAELNAFYKMRATERTADKLLKRQADNKTYYDLEGNTIKTPEDNYRLGGTLINQYPDGGILGATSNLVPTTPIADGPVIPDGQATRDFYTNWYSKRTLPFDEIGNKQYEKTMKSILPAYNPDSQLLNEINAKKVPYELNFDLQNQDATGALVYNKKGLPEKIELNPYILNDPAELNATMAHEERTRIMAPYADKVYPAEQMIIQPSIKTFEEGFGNSNKEDNNAASDYYDYMTSPQEDNIQSMLFEIRQKKNLQPDQTITEEDIQNWKTEAEQNGGLDQNSPNYDNALDSLFKVAKDPESLKNLFNYIASNNTPKANNMNMFPTYGGNFT